MPQYLAPGVYVEEVQSAIKPIAGVGTSTAGFIGVADSIKMPEQPGSTDPYTVAPYGEPQQIGSWDQFKTRFGDIQETNHTLAHAVYGFFNNGGGLCWVIRVEPGPEARAQFQAALDTFTTIDEIALVAIPGQVNKDVQNDILNHCVNAKDRFAILDGPQKSPQVLLQDDLSSDRDGYGAIYYPWIDVGEKDAGNPVYLPPSGHIAGIFARVDTERGVHKAPANEVIRGALGVETLVSRQTQGPLNEKNINVIRKFDGSITIWGARTLATDPAWRYINIRRLFNFLRESIDEGTQWVVFEPNAPELWSKIRRNATAFLTTVWSSGALFGATPEQAFYVRCDETTNPEEVRDLGWVVTEIGVAVVKPAEFVIFRISQWSGPTK